MLIEVQEDGSYKLDGEPIEITKMEVAGLPVEAVFHDGKYYPVSTPEPEDKKMFQRELKKALHNPELWEDK
ncbi:MAG: hypothetical protein GF375_04075 [Candidatus Omnitrophica bacterium]|nr:hypothetical protein [Candidatus Omnitrophota bacterium]